MSGDVYEEAERAARAPNLQAFLDQFADDHGISQEFTDASAHPYDCRCQKCLDWWSIMGPEEDGGPFGPFTASEIESYCLETEREIWWKEAAP